MAAQFLTISKLSNIISMISLGQQSGILRVIRGQGAAREIGQIKFVNGQPVSALLGQLTGANALSVLQNWGECVYAFEEPPPGEGVDSSHGFGTAHPASDPTSVSGAYGPPSGSWPAYSAPPTSPRTPPSMPSHGGQASTPFGASSQPGYRTASQLGGSSGDPYRTGVPYQGAGGYAGAQGGNTDPTAGSEQLDPRMLMLVPRRTAVAERIDQLPLDRRERMVLLLVDGQRNLSDLARLTRRTERELLAVLDYLAGLGLVELRG